MTTRTSSFFKRFFLIFGIAAIFQGILSFSLFMAGYSETKNILEREIANHFVSVEKRIEKELSNAISDLSLMAKSPAFNSFSPNRKRDLKRVENLFLSVIESRTTYDQIRYIDYRGNEKIRINRNDDGSGEIVGNEMMQGKSHRYYFLEAIRHEPGTIYISRLDLNMESGVLESPEKPTIRIIAVVKDRNGRKGLISVNLLAQSFINLIAERDHPGEYRLWMVNSAGHFFRGPNREFEWGFAYSKRAENTLVRYLPKVGKRILSSPAREGTIDDGTHRTIFRKISQERLIRNISSRLFKGGARSRYAKEWFLIGQVSTGDVGQRLINHFIHINLLFTLCIIIISLLGGKKAVANYDGMIKQEVTHKESEEEAVHTASYLQNAYHEIYAPLNGVIATNSLLHESSLDRYQKQLLGVLDTSAKSLMGIISDIPNQHLIENGKVLLNIAIFDLKKTIEEVSEMMAILAFSKGLEFQIKIDPKLEHWWRGDLGRIRRLIIVILSQSIKLTSVGKIILQVSQGKTHGVDFEVIDSGRTLSHSELHFVGQEFVFSKGEINSDLYGLSVFKSLTEAMGGTVQVNSNRGDGTRYSFTLPLSHLEHELVVVEYPKNIKHLKFMTISIDDGVVSNICDAINCIDGTVDVESSVEVLTLLDDVDVNFPYDVVFVDHHLIEGAPPIHDEILSKLIVVAPLGVVVDESYNCVTRPIRCEMILNTILSMPKFEQSISQSRGLRILAAIHDDHDLHSIDLIINSLGHDLTIVENGLEAVELIENKQFDIIFIGDELVDMEGIHLSRRIRDVAHSMPLVAISEQSQVDYRLACLHAGMEYYLRRPLSLERISRVIDQIQSTNFTSMYTSFPNRDLAVIFDFKELVESTGSDNQSVRGILKAYLSRSDVIMKKIDVSINRHLDLKLVAALMHELKGSSANIYAMKLTETIREVEGSISRSDLSEVRSGVEQVVNAKNELLQEIEKVLMS